MKTQTRGTGPTKGSRNKIQQKSGTPDKPLIPAGTKALMDAGMDAFWRRRGMDPKRAFFNDRFPDSK